MNKQEYIDWLKKVRNNQEEHSDVWYLVDEIIHESKKLETLSQEWVDENAIVIGGLHSNPQYIHVDELQNLLVPKQEKRVVPEYVAEYIEVGKDNAHGLEQVLTNVLHYEGEGCAYEYTCEHHIWARNNLEDFTLAFMFGYEIEKEPKYYAVVKGGDLLSEEKYWNLWVENRTLEIGDNKVHPDVNAEYMLKATKDEWNALGINDTNADFEEVDTNG